MKMTTIGLRIIIIGAFIFSFASLSHAQTNVRGIGAYKCGQLISEFTESTEARQANTVNAIVGWVQGYASGKNLATPNGTQKNLDSLLPDLILENINTFCSVNGDTTLYQIADAMYLSMPNIPSNNETSV